MSSSQLVDSKANHAPKNQINEDQLTQLFEYLSKFAPEHSASRHAWLKQVPMSQNPVMIKIICFIKLSRRWINSCLIQC